MARPRNEEFRKKILDSFWESFQKEGYKSTSYGNIAEKLDVTKALVQYHYPKKEQVAISFMERLLNEATDILHIENTAERTGTFANLYRLGRVYFAFLLQTNGYRLFLLDVISSRDLTEAVLAFNVSWALGFTGYDTANEPKHFKLDEVNRSVIVHMGGFYELLYHCLKNEQPFDVEAELRDVLEAFICALGYDHDQAIDLLASGTMSDADLEAAVASLNERLLFP